MKNSSFVELLEFVNERSFQSISLDIDGTLYPMRKMELRWWKKFFLSPGRALRFYSIKKNWEGRRKGDQTVPVKAPDVSFFEEFLTGMMDETLVPFEIRDWLKEIQGFGIRVYFLSDHGAVEKTRKLGLQGLGTPINCLSETGELKPHAKITELLLSKYGIDPGRHLHAGDRWTDEEQSRLLGCEFRYFAT